MWIAENPTETVPTSTKTKQVEVVTLSRLAPLPSPQNKDHDGWTRKKVIFLIVG